MPDATRTSEQIIEDIKALTRPKRLPRPKLSSKMPSDAEVSTYKEELSAYAAAERNFAADLEKYKEKQSILHNELREVCIANCGLTTTEKVNAAWDWCCSERHSEGYPAIVSIFYEISSFLG